MVSAPHQFYAKTPECIIVLCDPRVSEAVEELHHLRAVWQEDSDIEALNEDHFALMLWPGAAARGMAA
jgi:hypothetical protein